MSQFKEILLTGASGYIGSRLYKKLSSESNLAVTPLNLRKDEWKRQNLGVYDTVVHLAGIAHSKYQNKNPKVYDRVNRDLTVELAEKAKASGVHHFIFMSTLNVFDYLTGKIDPAKSPIPKTPYAKSKYEAEKSLKKLEDKTFKVTIIRSPMVFGSQSKGNYLMLHNASLKLRLFPYVKNQRSVIYIENLLIFFHQVIHQEITGILYPQNKDYFQTSLVVSEIASKYHRKVFIIRGFSPLIKLLAKKIKLFARVFGDFYIEQKHSQYSFDYQKYTIPESLDRIVEYENNVYRQS